ncbi:MAG: ABC transporter substrate-binding protein [Thermodesulfobacteriota bacterium]
MILWRGETEAEVGFKAELARLGYPARYTVVNADQDVRQLGRILAELQPRLEEFDYIYTFGTTVSRRARLVIRNRTPQIFNVVTDPVDGGIVDSMESPGGNISGVSDAVPVGQQLGSSLELLDISRLGILFNPREKNSLIVRKALYDYARTHDLEVIDLRSPPVSEMLQGNLEKLVNQEIRVDGVYLPPDSFLVSNAKVIGEQLRRARLKSIGSVREYIKHGVLIGAVVDYYQLGSAAARIVDRHRRGEKLENISVATPDRTRLVINKTTSGMLGIVLPEFISESAEFVD